MGDDDNDEKEQERLEAWREKREARKRARQDQQPSAGEGEMLTFDDALAAGVDNDEAEGDDADDHAPMTAAKRLKLEQEALLKAGGTAAGRRQQQAMQELRDEEEDKHREEETTTNEQEAEEAANQAQQEEDDEEPGNVETLLEQAAALQQTQEEQKRDAEETRILREASKVQSNALQTAKDLAAGLVYTKSMPSSWTCPRYIVEQGVGASEAIRKEWHMVIQGDDVPPPLKRFSEMKFPPPVLDRLKAKGISKPTPIQMQGLPVALSGRDMVGIAFTGSGKTLAFSLPLVMLALEEELRMPLARNEGPIGIILAPSRELARQTYELVEEFCNAVSQTPGYPQLRSTLMIGGENVRDQLATVQQQGLHCLVATPGRLRDVLKRKAISLSICRYICLDEADRMLDMGFDEEVGEIMNYFPHQRQTLLFSATFPKKFQDFARSTLVQPVVVNVGRAGAANLDVIQEVEYVKEEAKIVYLLHCLQKTAPPVIIFCERKGAADDIHEYLLLKGVEAVSIHGGKDQEERNEAIRLFKAGEKDVLIATDIAAKGLDFPDIQQVINFDMPSEIENYVHRIGRTGRCGKTGVATTFINKSCDETTLLDLKGLLREARQRIPPVLMMLDDPRDKNDGAGCSFCGGLGHTIVDCPKIDKDARRVAGGLRDVLSGGGDW